MSKLRYTSGVSVPAATWGSSTYGGNIAWGQAASDPITGLVYRAFPWPDGWPQPHAWRYRVGDTSPDLQLIVASQTENRPIDPDPISSATLILDRFGEEADPHQIVLYLTVEADRFRRILRARDLDQPGVYRCVVRLVMFSGRVLTVPVDDSVTFMLNERHEATVP